MDISYFSLCVFVFSTLCAASLQTSLSRSGSVSRKMATSRKVNVVAYKQGSIRSSTFPLCCGGDGAEGRYSYLFTCQMPLHDCRIKLQFTDLDLPCDSRLELRHTEGDITPFYTLSNQSVCGQTHERPMVISPSSVLHLTVIIPNGHNNVDHVGFKATYRGMIQDGSQAWIPPSTAGCPEIRVDQRNVVTLPGHVDCVWLIRVPRTTDLWIGNISGADVLVQADMHSKGDVLYDSKRDRSQYLPNRSFGYGLYIRARSNTMSEGSTLTIDFPEVPSKKYNAKDAATKIQRLKKLELERLVKHWELTHKHVSEHPKQHLTTTPIGWAEQPEGTTSLVSTLTPPCGLPEYFMWQVLLVAMVVVPLFMTWLAVTYRRRSRRLRARNTAEDRGSSRESIVSTQVLVEPEFIGQQPSSNSVIPTEPPPSYDDVLNESTPPSYINSIIE